MAPAPALTTAMTAKAVSASIGTVWRADRFMGGASFTGMGAGVFLSRSLGGAQLGLPGAFEGSARLGPARLAGKFGK